MVVNGRTGLKSITGFTKDEKRQYFADLEAQHCLVQSLTNNVYRKLDNYQNSAKGIWDQLEKIMLGSKVGNQLRVTAIMDRYENLRMREGETLDEAYDRFVVLNNEMKKNNTPSTEFDQNVKFLNNLTPEWKPFAHFVKQHKPLDELKLYEVFKTLRLYEEDVNKALEVKKKSNPIKDPIALVADKGKEVNYGKFALVSKQL